MFKLEFSTSNAAFDVEPLTETAAILREVARKIEEGDATPRMAFVIRDVNGNRIGEYKFIK